MNEWINLIWYLETRTKTYQQNMDLYDTCDMKLQFVHYIYSVQNAFQKKF
jgi:hypothetical protein